MSRFLLLGAWLGLGLLGCTPLGLWLYEDPEVSVSRVSIQVVGANRAVADSMKQPIVVALDVRNENDYAITAVRMELALRLDGIPMGQRVQDRRLRLPRTQVSTVAVPVVPGVRATPERLRSLYGGLHHYAVSGRAEFDTPVGRRRVEFEEEGSIVFGGAR